MADRVLSAKQGACGAIVQNPDMDKVPLLHQLIHILPGCMLICCDGFTHVFHGYSVFRRLGQGFRKLYVPGGSPCALTGAVMQEQRKRIGIQCLPMNSAGREPQAFSEPEVAPGTTPATADEAFKYTLSSHMFASPSTKHSRCVLATFAFSIAVRAK